MGGLYRIRAHSNEFIDMNLNRHVLRVAVCGKRLDCRKASPQPQNVERTTLTGPAVSRAYRAPHQEIRFIEYEFRWCELRISYRTIFAIR